MMMMGLSVLFDALAKTDSVCWYALVLRKLMDFVFKVKGGKEDL